MINGPEHCELNKMDTLIITLGLEVAIRENMMIEEEIQDEDDEEEGGVTPQRKNDPGDAMGVERMQEESISDEEGESGQSQEEDEPQNESMNDQ